MSTAFLLTALIVVATPGTGVVYTLAAGLAHGRAAAVVAAVGCTLGIVPHLVLTVSGLAALLQAGTVAFEVVKYLGVGYLLYMAWTMLRDREALMPRAAVDDGSSDSGSGDGGLSGGAAGPRPAAGRVIATAVLTNVLNPKLTVFFVAFLPQFVPAGGGSGTSGALGTMLVLSGVFMAMTFVVFAVYGVCAAVVRERVLARPRVLTWMRHTFAAAFVALGAKLAVA